MARTYSDGYTKDNNPVERLWPALTAGTIAYMLNELQENASGYRVHHRTSNPFDEEIDAAKAILRARIPLRSSFNSDINEWIEEVVEASWEIRYPVMAPKVLEGMYSVALACASEYSIPQLAILQARYGTLDSRTTKIFGKGG